MPGEARSRAEVYRRAAEHDVVNEATQQGALVMALLFIGEQIGDLLVTRPQPDMAEQEPPAWAPLQRQVLEIVSRLVEQWRTDPENFAAVRSLLDELSEAVNG